MSAGTINLDLVRGMERVSILPLPDADLQALYADTERWLALAEEDGKPGWLVAWFRERLQACVAEMAWRRRAVARGAGRLQLANWRDRIASIKLSVSLYEVVARSGMTLERSGRLWRGLCPFHAEKTPSFVVFPATQRWRCFGCDAGGDVIDYVMRHDGLTMADALTLLDGKSTVQPQETAIEPLTVYGRAS